MTTDDTQLAARFGFQAAQVVHVHTGYRGTRTVKLTEHSTSMFLRRLSEHWRGRDAQVRFELTWLDLLARRGHRVLTPLRTPDGQALLDDDGLPVTAFAPVQGEPRYPLTPEDARTLGAVLADLHLSPAPPPSPGVFRYDVETLLDAPLAFGLHFLTGADAREWAALGARWREVATAIPVDHRTFGAVHGDLHQWNVVWNDAGPQVLDFALCGVGYRLYDLAGFLWPLRDGTATDPAVRAMCDAFVEGYRSRRALGAEEEAALEVFVRLRDLWEMRDFADWEEKFNAERDVPGYLARFRTFPPLST
jgi:Ser/Thr protein kinase RdoA (MazF antagonist)